MVHIKHLLASSLRDISLILTYYQGHRQPSWIVNFSLWVITVIGQVVSLKMTSLVCLMYINLLNGGRLVLSVIRHQIDWTLTVHGMFVS